LGLGGKIKTKKRTKEVTKDEFADLGFGNPNKKPSKKDDNFDFGFADFGNKKKAKKNNDFDFGFGTKKKNNDPMNIQSRLGRRNQNKNQHELLTFQNNKPKTIKKDMDLLDFDLPPQKRAPKANNDDYDFL
jgi:hypothetical protein